MDAEDRPPRSAYVEEEEEEEEEDFRLTGAEEGEEVIADDGADDDGDVRMDDEEDEHPADLSSIQRQPRQPQANGGGGGETQFNDSSIAAFYSHRQSVFCISLHPLFPTVPLALTGGADDKGRIWNTRDGEDAVELAGHTDSVTSAKWNSEGTMAATGGMDGRVRIWKARPAPAASTIATSTHHNDAAAAVDWNTWEFLTNLEGPDEVTWLAWHPKGNVLTAGGADATVWMWQLPSGNVMQVFSGHTAAVTTGNWTPDGKKLVTASEDGSLIVWDPRSGSPLGKLQSTDTRFPFSSGGITSLSISSDNKVLLVGGAEGHVRLVNIAAVDQAAGAGGLNVVGELVGHSLGESIEGTEFVDLSGNTPSGQSAVAAPPTHAITVSTEGRGIVWDLASGKMRCEVHHSISFPSLSDDNDDGQRQQQAERSASDSALAPITSLKVHPGTTLFSTSSAEPDHCIKTWEARTGACIATQHGFTDSVLAMDVGRDDGYTQGAHTGGLADYTDLKGSRGWKIVGAGDEGVALVFRV